jgi:hypothetical protein
MACDLRCPNCQDNLGKDKENSVLASCGNCGEQNIYNEYGYDDELTEKEMELYKKLKRKNRGGKLISRY